MTTAKGADKSRYEISTGGDQTRFNVYPAKAPFPLFYLIVVLIPASVCVWLGAAAPAPFLSLIGLALLLIPLALWKAPRASKYRKEEQFVITPTKVISGNIEIPRDRVHRIILRNHIFDTETGSDAPGIVVGGVGGALVAGSASLGAAQRARRTRILGERSWRLDLEAGGTAYTLAGGLNETTAYALMHEVSKKLGLS